VVFLHEKREGLAVAGLHMFNDIDIVQKRRASISESLLSIQVIRKNIKKVPIKSVQAEKIGLARQPSGKVFVGIKQGFSVEEV
jgi:hypothetical protein